MKNNPKLELSVELDKEHYRGIAYYFWRIRWGFQAITSEDRYKSVDMARHNLAKMIQELRRDDFEVFDLTGELSKMRAPAKNQS